MTKNKSLTLQPHDLIVRFNEGAKKVLFLVPESDGRDNKLDRFYEFSHIEEFNQLALSKELGDGLIAFFRTTHMEKFPVTNPIVDEPISPDELEPLTKFEEADALIAQLGDQSELADLDAITTLLEQASAEGDTAAGQYLVARWPPLKSVFARRIVREKRLRGESS